MSNHINHILVAEFDIDKGSQLAHQYPEKTEIEEQYISYIYIYIQLYKPFFIYLIFFSK